MSPRELELPMPYSTGSSPLACRPSTRRPSAERLLSLRPPFAPQTQAVRARTTRDDSPGALVQWVFVCPAVYRLSTDTSFPYPVTRSHAIHTRECECTRAGSAAPFGRCTATSIRTQQLDFLRFCDDLELIHTRSHTHTCPSS